MGAKWQRKPSRKLETVIENETSPFKETAKRGQSVRPQTPVKSSKSVVLYTKSACTPFVEYANCMQDKLAQEAQSLKH